MIDTLVFLDLETTGLDSQNCAVHQMSATKWERQNGSAIFDKTFEFSQDYRVLNDDTSFISKIRYEAIAVQMMLSQKNAKQLSTGSIFSANDIHELFAVLDLQLQTTSEDKGPKEKPWLFVGKNPQFDLGFLRATLDKTPDGAVFKYAWSNFCKGLFPRDFSNVVDVATLARIELPQQLSYSLEPLYQSMFDTPLPEVHTALGDTRALEKIFFRLQPWFVKGEDHTLVPNSVTDAAS